MMRFREENRFVCRCGGGTMWLFRRGQGYGVARCAIERLYRAQGWQGAPRRGKFTVMPSEGTPGPADRVDRQFWAAYPDRLWVAGFAYVPTWSGMVYGAFMIEVFSRTDRGLARRHEDDQTRGSRGCGACALGSRARGLPDRQGPYLSH